MRTHSFLSLIVMLAFFITGCQATDIQEVVNTHGNIENIEALESFLQKVENKTDAQVRVVMYGTEGQRGAKELTYNGTDIKVDYTVDKREIEQYTCGNVAKKEELESTHYTLKECSGAGVEEIELLTVKK